MSDKVASVYIVDVGKSMGERRHGRAETDLDYALRYVWDKITTTVSNGRKTDMVGVIGLQSDNELAEEEAYHHLSVLSEISQFLMPELRELQESLKPSRTDKGDAISAIVLAIHMITAHCKQLKYIKNLILVTNGTGDCDADDLDEITDKLKGQNINLSVLGVDFDDEDYGYKEEHKDQVKAENEKALKGLCKSIGDLGIFGTLEQAVAEMEKPRLKTTRPVASYKGKLTLGDPAKYDTALSIDVERYPRTMVAKPVSATRYVAGAGPGGKSSTPGMQLENRGGKPPELRAVTQARAYQVDNDDEAGGKMEIEKEAMEKGYKYGRTVVPISSTDEEVTTYPTEPSMQILGFIPASKYKRHFHMSTINMIVGQKGNDKAAVALSSLIHALYELDSYALVRFVKKKNVAPVMMVLAAEIQSDFECLIDVQVPFIEDVRPFLFPPLGKVKTVTGKTLDKHRNIPTHDMEKFMSDYVDSMDISEFGKDDEGEPMEYAPIDDTFSPILHRINQCVRHRAIHPKDPLPPVSEALTKYSYPPEELIEKSRPHLEKLTKACDVKKVEAKTRSRKVREQPKPKSGLDLESVLNTAAPNKKAKISLQNAIPEFKQKAGQVTEEQEFKDLGSQMFDHVRELVKTSLADINYSRACEILRAVRDESREYEWPDIYNELLKELKQDIVEKKLDGNRNDMWWNIRKFSLGLLTKEETGEGTRAADEDEARAFWKLGTA